MKPKGSQFFWTKTHDQSKLSYRRNPDTGTVNNPEYGNRIEGRPETYYHLYEVDENFDTIAHGSFDVEWPVEQRGNRAWLHDTMWSTKAERGEPPLTETGQSLLSGRHAVGQQLLFDSRQAGRRIGQPTVTWAEMTKTGAKRLGEGLGIAQNDSTRKGHGDLQPDTDLSSYSSALVHRLQSSGVVDQGWSQNDSNQMDFVQPHRETPHGDIVKDNELAAGRQTIRKVLGGPRREMIRQQKAQRNQLELPF